MKISNRFICRSTDKLQLFSIGIKQKLIFNVLFWTGTYFRPTKIQN